jgi:hypothetical protein
MKDLIRLEIKIAIIMQTDYLIVIKEKSKQKVGVVSVSLE